MEDFKRWTIRNIDPETVAMINEIRAHSDVTSGELVNEAVVYWFESLDEEDEEDYEEDDDEI